MAHKESPFLTVYVFAVGAEVAARVFDTEAVFVVEEPMPSISEAFTQP